VAEFPAFPNGPVEPEPAWPRYAVYYAPEPGSPLAEFGADWLGRDCASGAERPLPTVPGVPPERFAEITESARGYGFHATLKPPFHLKPGRSPDELAEAVAGFAATRAPIEVRLGLRSLGGFLALMTTPADHRVSALAADVVRELDGFRALPGDAELARRRNAGLSPQQEELLQRWGYPYVMGEFRFHMTLTARLPDGPEREAIVAALEPRVAAVTGEPIAIDAVAVFRQDRRGGPFAMTGRFPFGG
jgi:putative phosphonate metabolism protein